MKVGDKVTWSSQAGGYTKVKEGIIVQVVFAGERPDREAFPKLYTHSGCGFGRNHDSYVVMVKRTAFWPIANKLKLVTV